MAIRRFEGEELRDDIQNLVVESKLIRARVCEKGWIEKYFLPEYNVYATFGCLYEPKRREATKVRGSERNIRRLERDYLS